MPQLTPLDYALIATVLVSGLIGLFRGIFREAMSVVVWIAAIWLATRYASALAPHLEGLVTNAALRVWAARVLLLLGVLVVGGIATWLIAMALHGSRLGGTDRVVGMVFGLVRGIVLAGLAIMTLQLAGLTHEPWWRESKLVPYAAPVAGALRDAAERGFGASGHGFWS